MKRWLQIFADENFTVATLTCVVVVCLFAFVFGVEKDLIIDLLIVGISTAFAEYRMRSKYRDRSSK